MVLGAVHKSCTYNELQNAFEIQLFHLFSFLFFHLSQQINKGPYIYDVHTEGGEGVLEVCHMFVDSIVFKQWIYCSFLRMKVGGSQNSSFFVDVINVSRYSRMKQVKFVEDSI